MKAVQPWPAGEVCPEPDYAAFASALKQASYHYADDSGKEWGQGTAFMREAVSIAVEAAWPYWVMKRMYREIAPLPTFDNFMDVYCKQLLAQVKP